MWPKSWGIGLKTNEQLNLFTAYEYGGRKKAFTNAQTHKHTCTSFIALAIKGVLVTTRCHSAQMSILGDAKARKLDSLVKLFSFFLGDREKILHTVSLISPFSSVKVFNLPFI